MVDLKGPLDGITKELVDLLGAYNMQQTIFEPTRKESLIDNVFINFNCIP